MISVFCPREVSSWCSAEAYILEYPGKAIFFFLFFSSTWSLPLSCNSPESSVAFRKTSLSSHSSFPYSSLFSFLSSCEKDWWFMQSSTLRACALSARGTVLHVLTEKRTSLVFTFGMSEKFGIQDGSCHVQYNYLQALHESFCSAI